MSHDSALKRLRAARAAREFPAVFEAVAAGRLNLTAVVMLTPALTTGDIEALLAAAANRSKADLEKLLAQLRPRPDLPAQVVQLAPVESVGLPETSEQAEPAPFLLESADAACSQFHKVAPGPPEQHARVRALSPGRYALQVTIGQSAHDKLREAQDLLGHAVPSGDLATVLERALDALVNQLKKRKFAATARPRRAARRASANPRHIPAQVKRAVVARDGGRCTFVSESGHRCEARSRLELDHVVPVARGGQSTVDGLRLRCRTHNQMAADQAFGAGYMRRKRSRPEAAPNPAVEEVIPWLRALGVRAEQAKHAAAQCAGMRGAPLEERVRVALRQLSPAGPPVPAAAPPGP
jgi:hypothetical protein